MTRRGPGRHDVTGASRVAVRRSRTPVHTGSAIEEQCGEEGLPRQRYGEGGSRDAFRFSMVSMFEGHRQPNYTLR